MDKEAIRTEAAPAPFQGAPYSQAIKAGGLLFVSGQVALQPGASEPVSETTKQRLASRYDTIRCSRTCGRSSRPRAAASTGS